VNLLAVGETLAALIAAERGPLEAAASFRKAIAGSESNLATGLARLGHAVAWTSRLGDDPFGRLISRTLRGEGVDLRYLEFDPERPTGLMVREIRSPQDVRVHYYRKGSAASCLGELPLRALRETRPQWLFLSGITPALSPENASLSRRLCAEAKELGVSLAFDPNLRRKLWPLDLAAPVLRELAGWADLVLVGLDEGRQLLGEGSALELGERFLELGAGEVVLKDGARGATALTAAGSWSLAAFPVEAQDTIGAGDAFDAGYLSARLDGLPIPAGLERGCALGALAVSVVGDWEGLPSRRELQAFLEGHLEAGR
jgi:2-dehydro-3-deoxygluconokinase